ncbi:hypothetical protein ABZV60_30045 [Streptomyces sp. NPDC004787]|uniref:hypothetical protein n=1 Tax=Streptomyces sp. NPDC004787 TaxID=3154291 RepID=UPI0033A1F37E
MSESVDAAEVLGRSTALERAARHQGGDWYRHYLLAFGGAQLFFVPTVLLWHEPVAFAGVMGLYVALVCALSLYAKRQRAVRRGFARRHGAVIGTWAAVYTVSVTLGTTVLRDSVPFALAATAGCVAPVAVAVLREGRGRA